MLHLIHRVAEADVVVVDTAGFETAPATVAMTAADAVLIPMVPGEGDVTEAARTVGARWPVLRPQLAETFRPAWY